MYAFLHELTFRGAVVRGGMNPYLYEHVNIREQCSWAHKHDPQGATAKALRLIAAAVGKLHHVRPLDQIRLTNHHKALVIGGGIAGMKAATDLASRGVPVILVEKSNRLGGHLNQWGHTFPAEATARDIVEQLERQVRESPRIEVLLETELSAVHGFVGNFNATLEGTFGSRPGVPGAPAHTRSEVTVGVIIIATGFRPYVPGDGEFLYNQDPGVTTLPALVEFMRSVSSDTREFVWNGRHVRRIAFIHCVGSRQLDGVHTPQPDGKINSYCSRVCCTTTLQQAKAVKERFPDVHVYDLHQDIRTYGRGHEDYYIDASKAGVVFFRYHGDEPPVLERGSGGHRRAPLTLNFKDYLTWGEELALPVDLVVLAVGMTPGPVERLVDLLKLPIGEDRFLQEIHPKLRPVEVSVNGALLAGAAQGPMNIQETLRRRRAAAAKASAMFVSDAVELQPYVAEVDLHRCDGAGICVTQCEYDDALSLVHETIDGRTVRRAHVNPGLCVGCGACVAVCPNRAINLNGWTVQQFDAMVDGLVSDFPEPAVAG